MAQRFSALSSKGNTSAANVAVQMGGTTTAEAQGIAEILKVMSLRPDLAHPILALCDKTKTLPIPG